MASSLLVVDVEVHVVPEPGVVRDAVAPLMAEPRSARKFVNIFPDDAAW